MREHDVDARKLDELERAILHELAAHLRCPEALLRFDIASQQMDMAHPNAELITLAELRVRRCSENQGHGQ